MKIFNYRMSRKVENNLKELMHNKIKKAELEERLRIELLHDTQLDPREWEVELAYNRTANCYDIHLKRIDRPPVENIS